MSLRHTAFVSLITLLVTALSLSRNAHQVMAAVLSESKGQSGVELVDVHASVQFGEQITFSATIKPSIPLQKISIMISDESQNITRVESLTLGPDGRAEFRLDTRVGVLHPFTTVRWNYEFTFPDGSTTRSQTFFIRYMDNRFDWQSLEAKGLKVNWYHGDANFGHSALDAAQAGLESIRRLMPLELAQPIEIFIYASADDFRATLVQDKGEWIAGHADPALGVLMVVIEPGAEQGILMEQRIPHELMHVMSYRQFGRGYNNVPAWLREGTATLAEMYPNAEYDRALAEAVTNDRLIPIRDLCTSFPTDAAQAFLAYAESRSFTGYIHKTYGLTGLFDLTASYADGVDCERGTERAFGVSLSALESEWRSSALGENVFLTSLQTISPYLVLLCLVLTIPLVGIAITLRKRKAL